VFRSNKFFYTIVIISLSLINSLNAESPVFTSSIMQEELPFASGVKIYDLDQDGDLDIIGTSAAANGNTIVWWRNEGGNPVNWTYLPIVVGIGNVMSVSVNDFNNDGYKDIVFTTWGVSNVVWVENFANSTWIPHEIAANFLQGHDVYSEDINGDSLIDIAAICSSGGLLSLWYNQGGNPVQWLRQDVETEFGGGKTVILLDLDEDNDNDILACAMDIDEISWWENTGGMPVNWAKHEITTQLNGAHRLDVVDLNADTHPDFVATGFNNGGVKAWINNGMTPPGWTVQNIDLTLTNPTNIEAVDYDNDSDFDMIVTDQMIERIYVYENLGGNPLQWNRTTLSDDYSGTWQIDKGDLDADGDDDFIIGAYLSNAMVLFDNQLYRCDFAVNHQSGHAPLMINFQNLSAVESPITEYSWDFDNDGNEDSDEQHPDFTYTSPGNYTVTLTISTATETYSKTYADLIRVFNGESALLFDIDSSAASASDPALNIVDDFTFEAWINPNEWGQNQPHGFGRIFDKGTLALFLKANSGGINPECLVLQMSTAANTGSLIYTPANSIELNTWQHVAVSYDGIGEVKMYVNSIEQDIQSTTAPGGAIAGNSANPLFIGNSASNNFAFIGIIDETRLWSDIRTPSEIMQFKDDIIDPETDGLLAYWRYNEAEGDIAFDQTSFFNLTLGNCSWIQGADLNHNPVNEQVNSISADFSLKVFPNPSSFANSLRSNTTVLCSISAEDVYNVGIYNIKGQLVKPLFTGKLSAGDHHFSWNGRDQQDKPVSSGMYFSRINNIQTQRVNKFLLMK